MPQVALLGHHHTCPMYGHVGEPISSGQSACTVNGIPVAVVGDSLVCNCPSPDKIVTGHASITINGIPVAITTSSTAHGGVIVQGDPLFTVT